MYYNVRGYTLVSAKVVCDALNVPKSSLAEVV